MTDAPFRAYEGDERYLFVCYGHSNSEVVYSELMRLHEHGFRIWYDEGISPGTVWRDELASAIERSSLFLFFVSPDAVASHHCQKEVSFAADLNLPFLAVHLEPTSLPRGLRLAILDRQAILKYQLQREEYESRLTRAIERQLGERAVGRSGRPHVPAKSGEDRIHVAVQSSNTPPHGDTSTIVEVLARYLSWQGGIYRPHLRGAGGHGRDYPVDYEIDVTLKLRADRIVISWLVQQVDTGEIVWAHHADEAATEFAQKCQRISEMIGEGAIRTIADHELRRIAGVAPEMLGYTRLILKADQLNYQDPARVAERFGLLRLAIALEPGNGLAHASLANLLSWQIINGGSEDPRGDEAMLMDETRLALQADHNDPFVLLAVGTTFCRMGKYDGGLGLIRRSHAMAPTVRAKDELARSLCFAGRPDEAIGLFEEILATMPSGHTFPYVRLAIALTQAGQIDRALNLSYEGIVHYPEDYYSWLVHANLLAQVGRVDESRAALAAAERLVPKLRLATVVERTESTYGRTEDQRRWLTAGLRSLMSTNTSS